MFFLHIHSDVRIVFENRISCKISVISTYRILSTQRYNFNPIRTGGGVESIPPTVFCPLLKKSSYTPYLKFLDFPQLSVADAPIKKKKKSNNYFYHLSEL